MLTEIKNGYTILNKNDLMVKVKCPICGNTMRVFIPKGYDALFCLKVMKANDPNSRFRAVCPTCKRKIKYSIVRKGAKNTNLP